MSAGIHLSLNPVQEATQITVSGTATGAQPPPNGVTIFFVPPSGPQVTLVTNLQATGAGGTFTWTGPVPGHSAIANGSKVHVVTNRQVSEDAAAGAFGPLT